jgi:hypothetical protein
MSSKNMLSVVVEDQDDLDYIEGDGGYMTSSPQYVYARRKSENVVIIPEGCSPQTCREGFLGDFRSWVDGHDRLNISLASFLMMNDFSSNHAQTSKDREKYEEKFHTGAEIGLSIANAFERKLGWKPLTHVFRAQSKDKGNFNLHPMYYIEGPKPWIKAPYYFSLYTFFFRVAGLASFRELKNVAGTDKILECMKACAKGTRATDDYADITRVRKDFDSWFVALEAYDQLFEKKKFKSAYLVDEDASSCDIGIDSLVDSCTPSNRLNDFMEKELRKVQK